MRTHLLASVFAFGACAPAVAADAAVEEVVIVDGSYDWSGLYVGAQLGYSWSDVFIQDQITAGNTYGWEPEPDGILGGGYIGLNYQMSNRLVLGVETEINANAGNGSSAYLQNGEVNDDSWPGEVDLKWSGSSRVRVGYAFDRWLPYVTGGVAYAGYDFQTHYLGSVYDEGDGTLVGWTLGGGVEYAVNDNWRVRGSYLFTDYDTETFDAKFTSGGISDSYSIDLKTHTVAVGVSYNW